MGVEGQLGWAWFELLDCFELWNGLSEHSGDRTLEELTCKQQRTNWGLAVGNGHVYLLDSNSNLLLFCQRETNLNI